MAAVLPSSRPKQGSLFYNQLSLEDAVSGDSCVKPTNQRSPRARKYKAPAPPQLANQKEDFTAQPMVSRLRGSDASSPLSDLSNQLLDDVSSDNKTTDYFLTSLFPTRSAASQPLISVLDELSSISDQMTLASSAENLGASKFTVNDNNYEPFSIPPNPEVEVKHALIEEISQTDYVVESLHRTDLTKNLYGDNPVLEPNNQTSADARLSTVHASNFGGGEHKTDTRTLDTRTRTNRHDELTTAVRPITVQNSNASLGVTCELQTQLLPLTLAGGGLSPDMSRMSRAASSAVGSAASPGVRSPLLTSSSVTSSTSDRVSSPERSESAFDVSLRDMEFEFQRQTREVSRLQSRLAGLWNLLEHIPSVGEDHDDTRAAVDPVP